LDPDVDLGSVFHFL